MRLPAPPRPTEPNGFPSIGVHSNFIRHLGILKESLQEGLERVWVLEDDACYFSSHASTRRWASKANSAVGTRRLGSLLCRSCFKHDALRSYQPGLVPFEGEFLWAHCYCVHSRILPQLVQYFEETLVDPSGHPRGGRLYIDGAFNLFRRLHPEVVCLVSNPNASSQKGSYSNVSVGSWYDRISVTKPLVTASRALRDELWRLRLLNWVIRQKSTPVCTSLTGEWATKS